MRKINSSNFDTIIKDRVLVQFSATWCGPCKILTQTIESNENKFSVDCFKIDLDESMDIANSYSVKAVPTLILFEDGKELKRITGSKPLDKLLDFAS